MISRILRGTTPARADRRREEGSAYVLTLMILLVLTIVGLSLTLVTQTEVLVGDQERVIQRVFYAAEGGLNLGLARALNYNPVAFSYEVQSELDVPGTTSKINVNDEVQVSGFTIVSDEVCPLCQENIDEQQYSSVLAAATSVATRNMIDLGAGENVPMARKAVTYMVLTFPTDLQLFRDQLQYDENRGKLIKL